MELAQLFTVFPRPVGDPRREADQAKLVHLGRHDRDAFCSRLQPGPKTNALRQRVDVCRARLWGVKARFSLSRQCQRPHPKPGDAALRAVRFRHGFRAVQTRLFRLNGDEIRFYSHFMPVDLWWKTSVQQHRVAGSPCTCMLAHLSQALSRRLCEMGIYRVSRVLGTPFSKTALV